SLLEAVEKKAVPPADISAYAARQIFNLGDAKVNDLLTKVWGEVKVAKPNTQQEMAKYKRMLTPNSMRVANLGNGRLVFSKTCHNCHKLFGEGGTIGPDLTGANRSNIDYLLSNIIDPSAEVGRDYRMSIIATKDERTVTGIIVEKTPTKIVVQTATDKQ